MTDKVLREFKRRVSSLVLIPSDKGRFEVSLDEDLVFSKLSEGRFPEFEEIKGAIEGRL